MNRKILLVIFVLIMSKSAQVLQNFVGNITLVEPTNLPGTVVFRIDAGNATCTSGSLLKWQKPDKDNNLAEYSALMAALVSRKRVDLYINNGDTICTGQFNSF